MDYKNLIVGAGITGITLAQKLASKGETVLIIDKRVGHTDLNLLEKIRTGF